MSLSGIQTAINTLITNAGYAVSRAESAADIPAHRQGKDVVVRLTSDSTARAGVDTLRLTVAGPVRLGLDVDAGHKTALTMGEAIRDALLAASALASVSARVLSVDVESEPTGTGSDMVIVSADIIALR